LSERAALAALVRVEYPSNHSLAVIAAVGGKWPITDEGVAVGGAFDSDTATGMMSMAHSRRRCASVLAIVIRRQEVRPMNAVSTVGAPLQSTIARLR
jgi:hypothetical protein